MKIQNSINHLNSMLATVSTRYTVKVNHDNHEIVLFDDSLEEIACVTKTIPQMELFVIGLVLGRDSVG
jgi:hypothetical protein